jgi:hypothetical protein
MSESKTSVRRLEAVEKQLKALELRKAGKTFLAIAGELGYASQSGAFKAVISALHKTLQEPADELRVLEIGRIDTALAAIWPQVQGGDLPSVDRFIRLSERRSKLLGLDAPTNVDVTTKGEKIGADDNDTRAEILRKLDSIATAMDAGSIHNQPDNEPISNPKV